MTTKEPSFEVTIEKERRRYGTIDAVLDYVNCTTHFEVDTEALGVDLKYMNPKESLELRDDCVIERIK